MTDISFSTKDVSQPSHVQTETSRSRELMYGWKCVTSKNIQCMNKPVAFLIILSISIFIESIMTSGYDSSTVSSIEKHFGLSSTQVSTFKTVHYVSGGIASAFIGYLGSSRKPQFIACGVLLLSIGSLIICLPKLLIGSYEPISENINNFCNANITSLSETRCGSSESWIYQLTFIIGYIFFGMGLIPIYTIGFSHLDDIFSREDAAKYMAFIMTNQLLGVALGYLIAMPILQVWVDLYQPTNHFDISHSNWVGAWWIGYLGGAVILLFVAIPMSGFPSQFPDTEAIKAIKRSLPDYVAEDNQITSWWTSTKVLIKNKVYIFITLATTLEELIKPGAILFMPKFLETKFHFSASMAALYSGIPIIIGGVGGTLFSGFIIKRCKWNCKQTIRFAVTAALLATLSSTMLLIPCNTDVVSRSSSTERNVCNIHCNCKDEYHPICTSDGESFYSPCYAGCSVENQVKNTFYNCSCFSHNTTIGKDRRCTPENCELFPLFFIGMCILFFFMIVNEVPLTNITLRVVNEGQGSAAMGFQKMVVTFLGSLPSPPIYGAFIDGSCILWASEECSDRNNCLEYDTIYFGYYFFSIAILLNFLGFCSLMTAYILYELPNSQERAPGDLAMDNIAYSIE